MAKKLDWAKAHKQRSTTETNKTRFLDLRADRLLAVADPQTQKRKRRAKPPQRPSNYEKWLAELRKREARGEFQEEYVAPKPPEPPKKTKPSKRRWTKK